VHRGAQLIVLRDVCSRTAGKLEIVQHRHKITNSAERRLSTLVTPGRAEERYCAARRNRDRSGVKKAGTRPAFFRLAVVMR
jgi:hypothetical protein